MLHSFRRLGVPPFVSAAAVDLNNAGRRLNKRRSEAYRPLARSFARSRIVRARLSAGKQAG